MADKTSLIITSTDTGGKTVNKTLTNINPGATKGELRKFAQGLNSLTTNTYEGAAIVQRTEIPTDANDPCFTVTPTTIVHDRIKAGGTEFYGMFTYEYGNRVPTLSGKKLSYLDITVSELGFKIVNTTPSGELRQSRDANVTFTLTLPAQDSYRAASVDVTITGVHPDYIVDIE